MIIEANGIKYFVNKYQEDRTKPNLILLHGFMGSGKGFESLTNHLKAFCNPITIDLLGHGKTGKASLIERFSAERQVDDLAQIVSKIDNSPSFLYGYSMGGRLASQFAVTYPRMLKGLILESTNPGLVSEYERAQRRQQDEERARAIEKDFDAFLESWKQLPLFKNSFANTNSLNHYHTIQKQNHPQQMANSLRGFGTGKMPAVLFKKIDLPVLLLAGSNDEKYVAIMRTMNHQNPNSTFQIVSNAGHRVHIDQPGQVSKHIQDFLNYF